MQGYKELGAEIQFFYTPQEINQAERPDIIVGYVGTIRRRLQYLHLLIPEMDYPVELADFLGAESMGIYYQYGKQPSRTMTCICEIGGRQGNYRSISPDA